MYPQDYRYTNDHEWIHPEGDRGRVGITDYTSTQLVEGEVHRGDLLVTGEALGAENGEPATPAAPRFGAPRR